MAVLNHFLLRKRNGSTNIEIIEIIIAKISIFIGDNLGKKTHINIFAITRVNKITIILFFLVNKTSPIVYNFCNFVVF